MATQPVIQFDKVSRLYGNPNDPTTMVRALDDVSFEVHPGEFVAIVGPSGSGKSTLLHLIGLLDRQTHGEILVDGVNTSKLKENQLANLRNQKIGFVFQQFNLLRRTSALINVELPLVYRATKAAERKIKAENILAKVGLSDRLNNIPSQLSGGQQQRVAIARALVTEPSLILADEPTGNLDSKSGEDIMQLFEKLHTEGVTIVMVTHNIELAKRATRQIMVMDGRII